jgi:hypothetical protein
LHDAQRDTAYVADFRNAGAIVDNSQDFRCSVMDKDEDQELMMQLLFLKRTGEEDVGA